MSDVIDRDALLMAIEMTPVYQTESGSDVLSKIHVVNVINNADAVMDIENSLTLRDAAISIHHLFVAYQEAGFTEAQALQLVKTHTEPGS